MKVLNNITEKRQKMDKRCLIYLFCLLTTVSTGDSIEVLDENEEYVRLKCSGNDETLNIFLNESGEYVCGGKVNETVTVRIRSSENLIQLDIPSTITILLGDIAATVLIGWAVYSICAQPKTKSNYQRNKASDRQNLINSSGGDTYQPLNTRSDDYSTLQTRHKNKARAASP